MVLSIITVVLNDKKGLLQTMESVFSQNYTDFEYIIIDGGSTDGTLDLIKAHEEKLVYWQSEKDDGIYNAMNKGIEKAKGEYIGFMNAGDYYVADVFSKVFTPEYIGYDILYGNQYFVKEDGRVLLKTKPSELSMYDFYWGSLYHQASFIKRILFENDKYNEQLRITSDAEFYIKKIVIEHVSYKHIGEVISYYNTLGLSSSAKAKDIIKKERAYLHETYFNEMCLEDYKMLKDYKSSRFTALIPEINKMNRYGDFILKMVKIQMDLYRFLKRSK